jgi:exodeoxyribonuclease VII large subunit
LSIYEEKGTYQISVDRLYPKGVGAGELALQALREKLHQKGYFDPRRKRKLPPFPRLVVLVTSGTGAAVHDLIEILGSRWPLTRVLVMPTRVQGDGAPESITAALNSINRWKARNFMAADVVILGRGGGASEDLSAFNEEMVADAIFRSEIPVVSAVGHEVDFTIADRVADVRASTPSHAAQIVVPDRNEICGLLAAFHQRMVKTVGGALSVLRKRLDDISRRRFFRSPLDRIRDLERRLDDTAVRLRRATEMKLRHDRHRVAALAGRLESLSPLQVLARGYSLTSRDDGRLVREAEQVSIGDRITTVVSQGRIVSRVEGIEPGSRTGLSGDGGIET